MASEAQIAANRANAKRSTGPRTEEGKAARDEFTRKQRDAESQVQPMVDRFRDLQEELKGKK